MQKQFEMKNLYKLLSLFFMLKTSTKVVLKTGEQLLSPSWSLSLPKKDKIWKSVFIKDHFIVYLLPVRTHHCISKAWLILITKMYKNIV